MSSIESSSNISSPSQPLAEDQAPVVNVTVNNSTTELPDPDSGYASPMFPFLANLGLPAPASTVDIDALVDRLWGEIEERLKDEENINAATRASLFRTTVGALELASDEDELREQLEDKTNVRDAISQAKAHNEENLSEFQEKSAVLAEKIADELASNSPDFDKIIAWTFEKNAADEYIESLPETIATQEAQLAELDAEIESINSQIELIDAGIYFTLSAAIRAMLSPNDNEEQAEEAARADSEERVSDNETESVEHRYARELLLEDNLEFQKRLDRYLGDQEALDREAAATALDIAIDGVRRLLQTGKVPPMADLPKDAGGRHRVQV